MVSFGHPWPEEWKPEIGDKILNNSFGTFLQRYHHYDSRTALQTI